MVLRYPPVFVAMCGGALRHLPAARCVRPFLQLPAMLSRFSTLQVRSLSLLKGTTLSRGLATYYTKDHEWVSVKGKVATIGITDHAQQELGDVVYVGLPDVGAAFKAGCVRVWDCCVFQFWRRLLCTPWPCLPLLLRGAVTCVGHGDVRLRVEVWQQGHRRLVARFRLVLTVCPPCAVVAATPVLITLALACTARHSAQWSL